MIRFIIDSFSKGKMESHTGNTNNYPAKNLIRLIALSGLRTRRRSLTQKSAAEVLGRLHAVVWRCSILLGRAPLYPEI
jgi:hypothetical protein